RRSRVPALPAVHALEIPAAAPARLHEIALLGTLGDEAHHVAGLPRLAEGATEPRRYPGAAAEVTGEPPAAVFPDIAPGGQAAANRRSASASPGLPTASRSMIGPKRSSSDAGSSSRTASAMSGTPRVQRERHSSGRQTSGSTAPSSQLRHPSSTAVQKSRA